MLHPIKTSHGIAILGACLLVAVTLIGWSSKQVAVVIQTVSPRTQLAAVGGSPTVVFLTSGTSWSVPSDWNSSDHTIEVIGGGAGGTTGASGNVVGGGGGAYA